MGANRGKTAGLIVDLARTIRDPVSIAYRVQVLFG
jgi:hypothetical protein